ncbi:MAG: hypothetical protein R3B70_47955 [Polyangiaceae bacterium]
MLKKLLSVISCLALSAAATGCVIVADGPGPGPSVGTGALTTYWSLDGSIDPDICWYYGVDSVDVAIYDMDDRPVIATRPYCEDFGVTFDNLLDDSYTVEVTLLDPGGYPLSDTVVVYTDVWAGDETIVDIDFPGPTIY